MTQTIFQGTFLVSQAAAAAMVDAKLPQGSIVNIASIIGKTGNMGQSNYAASKAGVMAFTKSTSKELAKYALPHHVHGFVIILFRSLTDSGLDVMPCCLASLKPPW